MKGQSINVGFWKKSFYLTKLTWQSPIIYNSHLGFIIFDCLGIQLEEYSSSDFDAFSCGSFDRSYFLGSPRPSVSITAEAEHCHHHDGYTQT